MKSILIANRGEIARRVIRTARSMGLNTVAVYTESDADSPHLVDADQSVLLTTNYADADEIVRAAELSGADSIHPGYGFGSENPDFAKTIVEAGLTWIGPNPELIRTMGDKLLAKKAAADAGLPCLDTGDGYPVIVKAVAGGGGKGMRIVHSPDQLADATKSCQREALKNFGNDQVFVERYIEKARHIEVQIVGDQHGNLVHLGERECSVQRRHQKIIEETPSVGISPSTRDSIIDAALDLGRSVGYDSVGTVEFVLDDSTGEFFFCEMNTRLQVEHPITEEVTGIDLVEQQILAARGDSLGLELSAVSFSGHSIEVRIYAEDPSSGFLPSVGTLHALEPPESPFLRWEAAVEAGSAVTIDFDPMIAKMIATGATRDLAIDRLIWGLRRIHIGGPTTNLDYLIAALDSEPFRSGRTLTTFVEETEVLSAPPDNRLGAMVAALWRAEHNRSSSPVLRSMPSGWRNTRPGVQRISFDPGLDVEYVRQRDGSFRINDQEAVVHSWSPMSIDLSVGNLRMNCLVTKSANSIYVQLPSGGVALSLRPQFEESETSDVDSALVAPMPGRVIEIRAEAGQLMAAGETIMVLEAMKMEHQVVAPTAGTVEELLVVVDQQLDHEQQLVVFVGANDHE